MQGQGRGKNEKGQGGKNEVVAKTKDKKALAGNERLRGPTMAFFALCIVARKCTPSESKRG